MLQDLHKLFLLVQRESLLQKWIQVEICENISYREANYPIYSFNIGTQDPQAPVFFITGGVHGLERIGSQLAWSLLKSTMDRLSWDNSLQELLAKVRLVIVPLVNPVGYIHYSRSNGNGVDLMRNSPVEASEKVPFLLGGHRISSRLPWYRGVEGQLEKENAALVNVFNKYVVASPRVVALDFHSGFGLKDRLWFPYSNSTQPFDHLGELHALMHLFEQTHPYHIYQIEPQSHGYLLSGDMWDYLYGLYRTANSQGVFIPLTLEMGSWNWVRKNPLQLFSLDGMFNPIKEHRLKRTFRRHHLLYDFMLRGLNSNHAWTDLGPQLAKHQQMANEKWY